MGAGWGLLAARAAFEASLLGFGGALVFEGRVAPLAYVRMGADEADRVRTAARAWIWGCGAVCLVALAVWAMLQTAELAGTEGFGATSAMLGTVLWRTAFGHVVLLQAALLGGAGGVLLTRSGWAAGPALACIAAQAGHGHGAAMGGVSGPLLWLSVVHLLAAAVWLGGLPPLLMVVGLSSVRAGVTAARWFSPLGKWAVAGLAGSALAQGWWLVGSLRALTQTAYGEMVIVKTALFAGLFALAVLNRYRWAPLLLGDAAQAASARWMLARSIAVQSALGLAAVAAACVLGALTPGMDMGAGS